MKTVSIRLSRVLLAVTAAGLVGLTAAGCASAPSASTPVTTAASAPSTSDAARPIAPPFISTSNRPVTTTGPATPTTSSSASKPTAQVNAVAVRKLQFPNTSDFVEMTGYDTAKHMVQFHKVVQAPGVSSADLIPDPSDLADHELPLAPNADIGSNSPNGFPYETCPPTNCTSDDMIQSIISHENNAFWAHIHVNAADQIDSVSQSAY